MTYEGKMMTEASTRDLRILNTEQFHGYGREPIPTGRDTVVGRVVASVDSADAFTGIVQALNPRCASVLAAFAERTAALAVRRRSGEYIRGGLVASALAYALTDDWRDVIGSLAVLVRAAEILDLDPAREFGAVAEMIDGASTKWGGEAGDWLRAFTRRVPADRSLDALGYVESNGDDGFRFMRTW